MMPKIDEITLKVVEINPKIVEITSEVVEITPKYEEITPSTNFRQRHNVGKYQCEQCSYVSHKPYVMKAHMKKLHNLEAVEYICERERPEVKHFMCQQCHYSSTNQGCFKGLWNL